MTSSFGPFLWVNNGNQLARPNTQSSPCSSNFGTYSHGERSILKKIRKQYHDRFRTKKLQQGWQEKPHKNGYYAVLHYEGYRWDNVPTIYVYRDGFFSRADGFYHTNSEYICYKIEIPI